MGEWVKAVRTGSGTRDGTAMRVTFTYSLVHSFTPLALHQTAAAPPTISESSLVIAACRVLL